MAGRASLVRAEPGFSLPFFDRLAPAPPPALVHARIETHTAPGDIVLDLHGRGGWVAHAALERQRRAVSLESSPLTRLLAELVLRPPDLRHLDAAFQAMAASPRRQSSLKNAVGELYATRCPTCERALVADEVIWGAAPAEGGEPDPAAARKHYRCPICRGQRGGGDQRTAPLDAADHARAREVPEDAEIARARLRDRFPVVDSGDALVDGLLDLHTPRQLVGLEAILERIEGDLRAAPVEAALRLGFLHALLPASRLNGYPGRIGSLRIQAGKVRPPGAGQWRERNPWLAFEDGIRLVRGFIQRLEGGSYGSVQARLGTDLRSLADGTATAVLGVAGPSAVRTLGIDGSAIVPPGAGPAGRARIRLVLGQPPVRPNQERLSLAYWATAWTLGREAAAILPIEALSGSAIRAPWGWQAAALGRSLAAVEPAIARDGRVVFLVDDGGADALVAAALGGVQAGFRLARARLEDADDEVAGVLELVPPGAILPPAARTRANVTLDPVPGGAGDPDVVPGRGLFVGPERFDRRPYSPSDIARTVSEIAVETLKARGEPARHERLLGEILVGLDRAGQLRRLVAVEADAETAAHDGPEGGPASAGDAASAGGAAAVTRAEEAAPGPADVNDQDRGGGGREGAFGEEAERRRSARASGEDRPSIRSVGPGLPSRTRRAPQPIEASTDQVERLLALIREELGRPDQRRVTEIEPGRWWLADKKDQAAAAAPLADRVEWAVYSLLSTAGPLSEAAFFERIAALFSGPDLPDEALVRACLQSYRSMASTPDRLVTGDDLLRRAQDHAETIAMLADSGHRLGMNVWIGRREQARKLGSRRLGEWLDEREHRVYLAQISRAVDDVAEVDCLWYVRGRAAFLFEVEWTAMLGETMLKRHARIPTEDSLVRFLVVAPERTELVRHKLERSPLLREALERDNWHILKWNHLRSFIARDPLELGDLEPYLGLDPVVERSGDQLPLFEG
ncbi:MAG TPA: hypothetical protein VFT20_03985 [Candidatus Limnocylindrales bacterium]|nr:hypothetical protein [Candidatus Limnocylindrales bacterium]